jgi:shikimate dehydrogenase
MMRLGLTGWPVSHSLSPNIQNAALQALGVDGVYGLYPVDPAQPRQLAELLGRLRSGELAGLNVTIPHKQAVLQLVDELSNSARGIGAVNTLYMRSGRLVGHNTDAPGFLADLRHRAGAMIDNPGNALVLGAGGSARAVVSALAGIAWRVTVAARNLEQAQSLAESLKRHTGKTEIFVCGLDAAALEPLLGRAGLVINTTPLGMHPKTEYSAWPDGLPFRPGAFVYDLVYNPRETLLLKQARLAGLQAATGLGMLIEQAALAFEIWTGKPAPREIMFSAVSPAGQPSGDILTNTAAEG